MGVLAGGALARGGRGRAPSDRWSGAAPPPRWRGGRRRTLFRPPRASVVSRFHLRPGERPRRASPPIPPPRSVPSVAWCYRPDGSAPAPPPTWRSPPPRPCPLPDPCAPAPPSAGGPTRSWVWPLCWRGAPPEGVPGLQGGKGGGGPPPPPSPPRGPCPGTVRGGADSGFPDGGCRLVILREAGRGGRTGPMEGFTLDGVAPGALHLRVGGWGTGTEKALPGGRVGPGDRVKPDGHSWLRPTGAWRDSRSRRGTGWPPGSWRMVDEIHPAAPPPPPSRLGAPGGGLTTAWGSSPSGTTFPAGGSSWWSSSATRTSTSPFPRRSRILEIACDRCPWGWVASPWRPMREMFGGHGPGRSGTAGMRRRARLVRTIRRRWFWGPASWTCRTSSESGDPGDLRSVSPAVLVEDCCVGAGGTDHRDVGLHR